MAFTLCAPILDQLCNPRLSVFSFSVGGTCTFEDTEWTIVKCTVHVYIKN